MRTRGSTPEGVLPARALARCGDPLLVLQDRDRDRADSAVCEERCGHRVARGSALRKDNGIPLPIVSALLRQVHPGTAVQELDLNSANAELQVTHAERGVGVAEESGLLVLHDVGTKVNVFEADFGFVHLVSSFVRRFAYAAPCCAREARNLGSSGA